MRINSVAISFTSLFALGSFVFSASSAAALPYKFFPEFKQTEKTVGNKDVPIAFGKAGIFLVFTGEHCPTDQEWRAQVNKLGALALKNDINVFLINSYSSDFFEHNSTFQINASLNRSQTTLPYFLDRKRNLANAFKIQRTPTALLFNAQKKLVYFGSIGDPASETSTTPLLLLQTTIENLGMKKDIPERETDILGCSLEESLK